MRKRFDHHTARRLVAVRLRLENWLARHPPQSLQSWAERWVLRTLMPTDGWVHADRRRLVADRHRLERLLADALGGDVLCVHLTAAMAVTWAHGQNDQPAPHRSSVLALARAVAPCAPAWREPYRSVYFRWGERLSVTEPGAVRGGPADEGLDASGLASMLLARTHGGRAPLQNIESLWYGRLSAGKPAARIARLCLLGSQDARLSAVVASSFGDIDDVLSGPADDLAESHRFVCRALLGVTRLDAATWNE